MSCYGLLPGIILSAALWSILLYAACRVIG